MRNIFTRNLLILVSILMTTGIAIGQTYNVTSGANNGPGTLRNAINQANSDAFTPSFITFDPAITVLLTAGQLVVNDELVITGNADGSTIIDGTNANNRALRFVDVSGSFDQLTFKNFTSNANGGSVVAQNAGTFDVSNCVFTNNEAQGVNGGGALYLNNVANSTVTDSEFNSNTATATAGSGGAIFVNSSGVLVVSNSTFTGNSAVRAGGAVETNSAGMISFTNSNFVNNTAIGGTAPGNGGAFHISGGGNSTFTDCIVQNNTAVEGGGLWNGAGIMTITGSDTELSGNEATGNDPDQGGGALYNDGGTMNIDSFADIFSNIATGTSGSGGAILSTSGTLNINSAALTSNGANRAGGGIEIIDGAANLVDLQLIF